MISKTDYKASSKHLIVKYVKLFSWGLKLLFKSNDDAVDWQKHGFWILLLNSRASLEQFYIFNYVAEGQLNKLLL